jgi:hypothetical protein
MTKCAFKPETSTFTTNNQAAAVAGVSPQEVSYTTGAGNLYSQIWNQGCSTYGGYSKKRKRKFQKGGDQALVMTSNGSTSDTTNNKLMEIAATQKSQSAYDSGAMSGGRKKMRRKSVKRSKKIIKKRKKSVKRRKKSVIL